MNINMKGWTKASLLDRTMGAPMGAPMGALLCHLGPQPVLLGVPPLVRQPQFSEQFCTVWVESMALHTWHILALKALKALAVPFGETRDSAPLLPCANNSFTAMPHLTLGSHKSHSTGGIGSEIMWQNQVEIMVQVYDTHCVYLVHYIIPYIYIYIELVIDAKLLPYR